ncbi:MAG: type II secretion system secretin GspD [Pseudomonadales bacterium]|nr:type II secretion system secretin GspD [Pseudomonadales bacterium]
MKHPHRSLIDPGNGKEVTSRTLLPGGEIILFAFFTIALPACSVLEAQPSPVTQQTSGQAGVSTQQSVANNQTEIATLTGVNGVDQQAIIEEINRDGPRTSYPGFSEEVPAPVVSEEVDVVEFNYEQADLRLVLEELADALDITILIDPSIDNRVSIRTSEERPLQENDIWPLMRLLTRDAGIVLERVGDVYNARRLPSNLPADIVTPDTLGDGTAARIAQVTPLTYVSSAAVIQAIAPMLEPDGAISQLGSSNLLVISGSEFQLQRVNQILMLIDADPFANQGMHLYQLSNANAVEVAAELAEILLLIEGPNPAYQVRGIERINSILVTAPASRGFDEVSRWVQILDADSQQQVEQLFMYRVKHLAALELAETLSTVFEEEDEPVIGLAGVTDGFGRGPQFGVTGEADESQSGASQELASQPGTMPTAFGLNAAVSANLSVKIVADETTNSLLIRSSARDYRQLLTTISQLDVVPLQVMVNAVIAQITLTEDTRFGVDWSRIANDAVLDPISTRTNTDFSPNLGGLMFTKGFLDGSARVEATLEAIAVDNDVRLLARPSLTVSNNQEGEIQIGAEVPVEAGESISAGGLSTTNIQYRPTGIELYITPQINDDGIVNLTIRQVLSSVDSSAAGVNNNPVFNNQEISTTVVVRNGENIVLGGLIQTDSERLNTGVPGLNRLPVVGNLFSYQRDSIERRELFIVLRPEIINLNAEGGVQYSDILDRFELASELLEDLNIQ